MIYLLILLYIFAGLCVLYVVFNPMTVLSWFWVKGKNVCVEIWNMIKGFLD